MARFERFEEIEAWQLARELVRGVYAATGSGQLARDFALRDQLRRAAVSAMGNIAEGFERGGNREFLQFLAVAKGSAGEVRSHLCVVADAEYLPVDDARELAKLAVRTSRAIAGLMRHIRKSGKKGAKYRPDEE